MCRRVLSSPPFLQDRKQNPLDARKLMALTRAQVAPKAEGFLLFILKGFYSLHPFPLEAPPIIFSLFRNQIKIRFDADVLGVCVRLPQGSWLDFLLIIFCLMKTILRRSWKQNSVRKNKSRTCWKTFEKAQENGNFVCGNAVLQNAPTYFPLTAWENFAYKTDCREEI